jgi:exosortase
MKLASSGLGWLTCVVLTGFLFFPAFARYADVAFVHPDSSYAGLALLISFFWAVALLRIPGEIQEGSLSQRFTNLLQPFSFFWGFLFFLASGILILGNALNFFFLTIFGFWGIVLLSLRVALSDEQWIQIKAPRWFSLLGVPIPATLIMELTGSLKSIMACGAGFGLKVIGIPHVVSGFRIATQNTLIEVVPACSGFRTLVVMCCMCLALALHWGLNRIRSVLFVALAGVVATTTNVFRIVAAVLIAHCWQGGSSEMAHTFLALLFDGFGLYFLFLFGMLLRPCNSLKCREQDTG